MHTFRYTQLMKQWIAILFSFVCLSSAAPTVQAHDSSDQLSIPSGHHIQSEITLSPAELKWLQQSNTISYVYDPDWAPFEWKNEIGNHTGIISDILELIQKKSGIRLTAVKSDTWAESVELVQGRKVEMFSAITQNSDREAFLNFTSRDIYAYPAVLVTHFEDKKVYLDIDKDIQNKTIGIVKGSGLGQYIQEQHPKLKFVELPSTHDGFTALQNEQIDLFAINTVTAKYYIEKQGFDDLKIALKLDYIYHLKMAVHKDLPPEIISILDKSLAAISEHELNDIFNHWTEIIPDHHTNWKLPLQICAAMMIIILFLFWSNRRLNRKVEARTEELQAKNLELSQALDDIKTLQGFIPICSYCHSIRDDEGAWSKLEAYLSKHSDAQFSHGICPKCHPKVLLEAEIDEDINQL